MTNKMAASACAVHYTNISVVNQYVQVWDVVKAAPGLVALLSDDSRNGKVLSEAVGFFISMSPTPPPPTPHPTYFQ